MKFSDIPGNNKLKELLVSSFDTGRMAHAMLFYENEGCGGLALALAFIQYMNCQNRKDGDSCGVCPACNKASKLIHPDVQFVFPVATNSKNKSSEKLVADNFIVPWRELVLRNPYFLEPELYEAIGIEGKSGNISVAQAKSILENLSFSAIEGGYKVVLMWLPEKMNIATANKLLKIIEEPSEKIQFLFITQSPNKVLQTIFSRCQSLRVLPLAKAGLAEGLESIMEISADEAANLAAVSAGSIGKAIQYYDNENGREVYVSLFADLMKAIVDRRLWECLEVADSIVALDSREKQKSFCIFVGDSIRKIFMVQQNMSELANIHSQEMAFYEEIAPKCTKQFCRKVLNEIDNAAGLIERNVSSKMIFVDLVNKMFRLNN